MKKLIREQCTGPDAQRVLYEAYAGHWTHKSMTFTARFSELQNAMVSRQERQVVHLVVMREERPNIYAGAT